MPDDSLGRREIRRSKGLAKTLLGSFTEIVVLPGGESLVWAQFTSGTEGKDRVSSGVKGQFCLCIPRAHRINPGINIILLLFQGLVSLLHLHLVTIKPPA